MLRIMHMISDLDLGGAEAAAAEMALGLDRARFSPSVCCLRKSGALAERLRSGGVSVYEVRFAARTSMVGIIRLASLLRRAGIHIVHTHLRRAGTAGRLAAFLARTPCAVHHEHSLEREPNLRQRWLYRWLTRRTQAVLCVSRRVLAERLAWTSANPRPFRVFYNFVDRRRFQPRAEANREIKAELGLSPDSILIGTVGRLSPIKNQALFLRSAAAVSERMPQARFIIVGDGRLRPDLEKLAADLGVADRAIFTGSREDVERFYAAFDLFALTSSSEGFGLAAVEAQACGAPVVCTAAGATSEVVAHEISGLIAAEHTPQAVAAAMLRILQDKTLAERLRSGGLESAKRFDREDAMRRLEEIYLSLCPQPRREAPAEPGHLPFRPGDS